MVADAASAQQARAATVRQQRHHGEHIFDVVLFEQWRGEAYWYPGVLQEASDALALPARAAEHDLIAQAPPRRDALLDRGRQS